MNYDWKKCIESLNLIKNFDNDENTKVRKKSKNGLQRDFLKLMNNATFVKTMENVRKLRDIKLVTTEKKRNYLLSKRNYISKTFFTEIS